MAYIHCSKCSWQQDDFYAWPRFYKVGGKRHFTWGYHPFRKIAETIKWLWIPRFYKMDGWLVGAYGTVKMFTWTMMYYEFRRIYRSWKNMKWYTMKALKKDKNSYCPKCQACGKGWWVVD